MLQPDESKIDSTGDGERAVPTTPLSTPLSTGRPLLPIQERNPRNMPALPSPKHPPHSPAHRLPTTPGSPKHNPRFRSQSYGHVPLSYIPNSPYAVSLVPASPINSNSSVPRMPFLPPEHSEQRKAMENAAVAERKRAKEMEAIEINMTADELRQVLKRERHRMGRMAADFAALKASATQCQLEAEVIEEGRINALMRRMDGLQREKGRIIVELEREEEMLTNTLQKKLEEVKREKAALEQQIEKEKKAHAALEVQLGGLRDTHLTVAEALEEQEEMEEE